MEKWANARPDVRFVCLCVQAGDKRLSQQMGQQARLSTALNGLVEREQDMPRYGQLGCSGFIVFDTGLKCVASKTQSFLDHGDKAFASVEKILAQIAPSGLSAFAVGAHVEIFGLTSAAGAPLNGSRGAVASHGNGRVNVELNGEAKAMKPDNLRLWPAVGAHVEICGLTSAAGAALNGQRGVVASHGNGRVRVELQGEAKAIKPDNLRLQDCAPREVASLPPVGVPEMDRQHEECTLALRDFAAAPSDETRLKLRQILEEHFADEEAYMEQIGFGRATACSDFSALKTHTQAHAALLRLLDAPPSREVALELSQRLEQHAQTYDAAYGQTAH